MKLKHLALGVVPLLTAGLLAGPSLASANSGGGEGSVPKYDHIVVIMMENQKYSTIIGNPAMPNINGLANTYGLATDYFGVTHPSEPNYVALVGGSFFGIQDDNQFYCIPALASTDTNCAGTTVNHTIANQSIADQLTAAGKTWKGYFQNLPFAATTPVPVGPNPIGPYTFKWPSTTNALYASKHNPFVNFTGSQTAFSNMVPDSQLGVDLATGQLPNFSLVVPDQCNDMHGTAGCSDNPTLFGAGDAYVGRTVSEIMAAPEWNEGRNAIVITWDEDDFSDQGAAGTGCCTPQSVGGGQVATIVIKNHEAKHVTDPTAYNHYSLLRTMEDAFGLSCLQNACVSDNGGRDMTPLFRSSD